MKKWEKEILAKQLQDESQVTILLENTYKKALDEINDKIQVLKSKEQTQSVIYQLKYQQALEQQVSDVYTTMAGSWYQDIDSYLKDCYEDSFYSTMYALHQEGIPIIIPFNQETAVQAAAQDYVVLGDKLSQKLYDDAYKTANSAVKEITKGIAMNSSYGSIALAVAKSGTATLNQALRITRTEGHRIQEEVKFKTTNKAKEKGADVVKQWDSTIDRRTRPSHAALDGQLREVDQPFKSPTSGHTAMYPGGFGVASEDIHCRCVCLQRARWALDKSELDKHVGNLDGMTDDQLEELAKKLGVSKDELIKKSNGIIESDGSINHRIKAQNYNQFKKKYQKKEKQAKAQAEGQAEAQKLADLQNAVNNAQNELNGIQNKSYSGVWKDPVSLSDYEFKKDSIAKKKDYFLQQIDSLKDSSLAEDKAKVAQYQKYLDDLDDFETQGSKFLDAKNKLKALQKELKAASGSSSSSPFTVDAYSDARKKAAKTFSSRATADKYHRPILDDEWDNLTDKEKYSLWEYTRNSNPMNKPLSGYVETWSRSNFKGVGNVSWGYEDKYRSLGSKFAKYGKNGQPTYYEAIKDLTNAIDHFEFQDDIFLVRGSDSGGFAGLLESNILSFDDAKRLIESGDIDTLKQIVEGQTFQSHSFMSTAISSGAGFGGNVKYEIYAPKGTHGIYAEPQSYFGDTVGSREELYKTKQDYSSVGGEAEVVLQRGTEYRITGVEYSNGQITVKMEVSNQPDYFETGYEDTFNNGATKHQD